MSWKERAKPVSAEAQASDDGGWKSRAVPVSDDMILAARQAERPKTELGESVLRGAAQGASFGWADELTAAVGAAKDSGAAALGLRGDVSFGDAYKTYIDRIRAKDDAAKADNPKAYTGGAIAGGVGSALGLGIAAKGLGQASNLGSFVSKVAQPASVKGAVGSGALLGGVTGAGLSEANPTESPEKLKELAKDTAVGAGTGAAFGGAGALIGKAASALKPSNLRQTANIKALKAAGYMGPDLKRLSEAQKQEIGRTLLDKGVVKAFDGLDDVASKAAAGKEEAGQAIGKALQNVDDLVTSAKGMIDSGAIGGNLPARGKAALKDAVDKQFQFNMGRIGQRIESELIAPNQNNPLLKGELSKLRAISDDFLGGQTLSLSQGNVIKGTQGKITNFNSDTVPQAFKRELYDIIKTEIDDIVAKTGNLEAAVGRGAGNTLGGGGANVSSRNSSISSGFQGAKRDYAALARTTDVAESRLGQLQANREVSLTDTIAGAGGLASGGPGGAIVIGGLNKLARQYGDSMMAVSARKTAEIIEKSPQMLGPFAALLEEAAKRGAPALNATHLRLTRDPDFQRILADYEDSKSPVRRRIKRLGE